MPGVLRAGVFAQREPGFPRRAGLRLGGLVDADNAVELASTLHNLGVQHDDEARYAEARQAYGEALDICRSRSAFLLD
jgi:hypothetical protein